MGGGSSRRKADEARVVVPAAGMDPAADAAATAEGGAGGTIEAAFAFERTGGGSCADADGSESVSDTALPPSTEVEMSASDIAEEEWREEMRRTFVSFRVLKGSDEGTTLGPVKLRFDAKVASIGSGENNPFRIAGIEDEHGLISYLRDQLLYVNSSDARTLIDGTVIEADAGPVDFHNGSTLALGENAELLLTTYTEFEEPSAN